MDRYKTHRSIQHFFYSIFIALYLSTACSAAELSAVSEGGKKTGSMTVHHEGLGLLLVCNSSAARGDIVVRAPYAETAPGATTCPGVLVFTGKERDEKYSEVRYEITNRSANPADVTLSFKWTDNNRGSRDEPGVNVSVPGTSVCSISYQPQITVTMRNSDTATPLPEIFWLGKGSGTIDVTPSASDNQGAYISNASGDKIYVDIYRSGEHFWNGNSGRFTFPVEPENGGNEPYKLLLRKGSNEPAGLYSGSLTARVTCN